MIPILKHRIEHFASVVISAQVSSLLKVRDETFEKLIFTKLVDILSVAPQNMYYSHDCKGIRGLKSLANRH
jgi:hypothetical protein